MTGTNFASYIRHRTKTNTSTLTNADIVLLANVVKDDLAALIATNVDENYFDMEMTRDLEADIRDYTFESDVLKNCRYVAAKLDGTNWTYLTEADFGMMEGVKEPMLENTYVKSYYADKKAQYLISGMGLRILSGNDITAVDEGLKVVAEVYPEDIDTDDITGSADLAVPSSDQTLRLHRATHRIWAKMIVIEYKQSREKPIPLTEDEKKIEIDLSEMYKVLRKRNAVRSFVAGVPNDDGQDY